MEDKSVHSCEAACCDFLLTLRSYSGIIGCLGHCARVGSLSPVSPLYNWRVSYWHGDSHGDTTKAVFLRTWANAASLCDYIWLYFCLPYLLISISLKYPPYNKWHYSLLQDIWRFLSLIFSKWWQRLGRLDNLFYKTIHFEILSKLNVTKIRHWT